MAGTCGFGGTIGGVVRVGGFGGGCRRIFVVFGTLSSSKFVDRSVVVRRAFGVGVVGITVVVARGRGRGGEDLTLVEDGCGVKRVADNCGMRSGKKTIGYRDSLRYLRAQGRY